MGSRLGKEAIKNATRRVATPKQTSATTGQAAPQEKASIPRMTYADIERAQEKDATLVERMYEQKITKTTNVIPTAAPMTEHRAHVHKPLPSRRSAFDVIEDRRNKNITPRGKIQTKDLVEILMTYESDPKAFVADRVADKYGLGESDVRKIVTYNSQAK